MKKLVIPQFANETEEAAWWYAHKDVLEANMSEALRMREFKTGTAKRLAAEARGRGGTTRKKSIRKTA